MGVIGEGRSGEGRKRGKRRKMHSLKKCKTGDIEVAWLKSFSIWKLSHMEGVELNESLRTDLTKSWRNDGLVKIAT